MTAEAAYDISRFPAWRRPFWHFMHALCYLWFALFYRFRAYGSAHIPKTGPLLVVTNHQSFLDPIIVGLAMWRRPFWALARKTLFDNPRLGWLIRSLNAIPVDQEAGDMKSMRACLETLKLGRALVIYPEGARTLTGKTEAFAPGMMMLIKRTRPIVLPAAIEGAYDVYPRRARRPKLFGRIAIKYGEPIDADTLLAMGNDKALEHLRQTVETMRLELAGHVKPNG